MHYEVIVIGVGSMGSAACWYLANRGHKVLGLEQFDIAHDRGSHAGQSRIIRKAYFEHPDYVPLLERAYENWREIETASKSDLFYRTGLLYFGRSDNQNIVGVRDSARLYNIPIENLSASDACHRYPGFVIPDDFDAIYEDDAGFVTPERTVMAYTKGAIAHGAEIRANTRVESWKQSGRRIEVITNDASYTCDKLIITAGAWSSRVIPPLKEDLTVTRQVLAWVDTGMDTFSREKFPCWFVEDPERGTFYGFPELPEGQFDGTSGFKLAHHSPGELWNADREVADIPSVAQDDIRYFLDKYVPQLKDRKMFLKTCLYTYSRDAHFIIDHLPGYGNQVTIACGFSGHGFKFVPVVGEILADLAMRGTTDLPVSFLKLGRF